MANKNLTKKEKYVTGRVILQYCNFKTTYQYSESSIPKYTVTILLHKESNKDEIENMKNIITKHWKDAKLKAGDGNPLMNGSEKAKEMEAEEKDGSFYEDYYIFKSSSQFPIKVVNAKKQNFTGEDSEAQGHFCRLNLDFYAYSVGKNRGVSSYLKAVQILEPSGLEFASGSIDCFDEETVIDDTEEVPF